MVDRAGNDAAISDKLQSADGGRITAVVRLPKSSHQPEQSPAQRLNTLQDLAAQTQQPVETFVRNRSGISIKRQFWIANAVVIHVDTEQVPLESVARIEGVERIHENFEVEVFSGDRTDSDGVSSTDHGEYTYGLEQIDVPAVWEEYGTKGEGARVAVLDTGIDPDHRDLDLDDWAEFDSDGDQIDSVPYDSGDHGTHVSGTVAGGAESGEHIGVAPDCELYHGLVLDGGSGTWSQVIGGIQWAVESDADVINMSLGATQYEEAFIDALQNAQEAGTLPISSSGNDDEGTSGSPANVYGAGMAIGASDEDESIASFSSGETVVTDDAWGSEAEDDWPAEYIVPDVSAPGFGVNSTVPGGEYDTFSGTSMAAPHVAGVAALMISASGGSLTPESIWEILEETAWKPADWDEDDANHVIDGKDTRYGKGIVDAKAATDLVAAEGGIEGTVTSSSGSAVVDATIKTDDGFTTTTDSEGAYSLRLSDGEYTISTDPFGFAAESRSVTVADGSFTTENITLDPVLEANVLTEQPAKLEGGESFEATVELAHAETVTVSSLGEFPETEATVAVDGTTAAVGEAVSVADGISTFSVGVSTTEGSAGTMTLEITLDREGETKTVSTGETAVFRLVVDVGIVDADNMYGAGIVETVSDTLAANYRVTETTTNAVVESPEAQDVVVAQLLDSDVVEEFVAATDDGDVGVVYLDQWSWAEDGADAIPQYAEISDTVTETDSDFSNGTPSYEILAEHPVVNEFGIDAEIPIHDDDMQDHTWFETTDTFDSLANIVTEEEGTAGTGLAVDEESRTVLAATLGRSEFVEESDFTEDANAILASAVGYASGLSVSAVASYDDGEMTLAVDAANAEKIVVRDLFEWEVDLDTLEYEGDFSNSIDVDGSCSWSWGESKKAVSTSMTCAVPPEVYVGGRFGLTVAATAGEEWRETETAFSID